MIAGSSSTTSMVGITAKLLRSFGNLGADLVGARVPHVDSLDDLHHGLGDVLGVVAYALDRFGHEYDLERRTDRARVFHHVAYELAQDGRKRGVDLVVA